jgi:hypothetical protein
MLPALHGSWQHPWWWCRAWLRNLRRWAVHLQTEIQRDQAFWFSKHQVCMKYCEQQNSRMFKFAVWKFSVCSKSSLGWDPSMLHVSWLSWPKFLIVFFVFLHHYLENS